MTSGGPRRDGGPVVVVGGQLVAGGGRAEDDGRWPTGPCRGTSSSSAELDGTDDGVDALGEQAVGGLLFGVGTEVAEVALADE